MNRGHISAAINTKQKINLQKPWIRYTATDFQGWSKITLKIKMAYISIFRRGFQKFFDSHL